MKITNARFTDHRRELIVFEFEHEGQTYQHYVNYDPDLPDCKKILKKFPIQKLEKNFIEFYEEQDKAQADFKMFQKNKTEIMAIIEQRWHDLPMPANSEILGDLKINIQARDISVKDLIGISNDEEKFFKLKLEIFELPEIKAYKNTKLKSKLRKSTTFLELAANLHEVYCDIDSEQDESQD